MATLSNTPALLFAQLVSAWHADASSERVDQLAADLAARVASSGGLACVGLVRSDTVRRFFGLACFLDRYDLAIRQRYVKDRRCAFVFAEVQTQQPPSEYEGAKVLGRHLGRAA